MKRFVLLLCAALLFCAPAQGLAMGGGSAEAGVLSRIAEVDKEIIVLEQDEELTAQMLIPAGPYLSDTGKPYLLPMQWDLSAEELREPGLHLVSGTPLLEEGMTLAEGFDPTFTWPIFRIGEGAVLEMASVAINSIPDVLIEQNQDPLQKLAPNTGVRDSKTAEGWTLQTGKWTDFCWVWDLSAVDAATLGKYTVTAKLNHPDWVQYPEEMRDTEETVYVMPTDRIELYGAVRISSNGALELSWVYDSSNVTETALERKDETGQWVPCEESWYQVCISVMGAHDYLYLYLLEMPTEVPLTLRLRYQDMVDGMTVERITEPIALTVPANIAELVEAANRRAILDIISGNRDGGDSGGDDLPDYEQPSPTPDWGLPVWRPTMKEEEPVTEIITDTYTALSGLRVQQLVELGPTVLFEKQGISVEIPSQLLKELYLRADQRLEVTIEPQQHGVRIDVSVDGIPLENLGQTRVRMPWDSAEGTDLALLDANGLTVGSAVYEATGTALFTISQPGTYCLQAVPAVEIPAVEEAPKADTPPVVLPETQDSTQLPAEQNPEEEQLPIENVPKPEEAVQQEPVTDKVVPEQQQPAAEAQRAPFPAWWFFILIFPVAAIAVLLIGRWRHE